MVADNVHYVIVGGSAAGMAAAQAVREQDAAGTITVLSAEPDRPYFRPLIPYLVSGRTSDDQLALERSWQLRCFDSREARAAFSAFLARRAQ